MIFFVTLVVVIMLTCAIAACVIKDLLSAAIVAGVVSFCSAILFYFLQAPDVAIAEASIGAALVTAILIIAIRRTKREE
jgi:energy-converting hydrogenase B subunit D